jgi:hypothetical protein
MREMPKRLQMVYQDALDNLKFIKQQEWAIVRYEGAAFAALVAVSRAINATCGEKLVFTVLILATTAYSCRILISFIESLAKFRDRIRWLYKNEFTEAEQKGLDLLEEKDDFDTTGFIQGLIFASVFGALVAILAIWLQTKSG